MAVEQFAKQEIDSVPDDLITAATQTARESVVKADNHTLSCVFAVVNAALAARAFEAVQYHDVADRVSRVVRYAIEASGGLARKSIAEDVKTLAFYAFSEKWAATYVVPPDTLGPMWPHGFPKGWPMSSVPHSTP